MAKIGRFKRVVWIALVLELLERLAFYGVYINLTPFLTKNVGLGDRGTGYLMGGFDFVRALVPLAIGAAADWIGFGRSLAIAFALYVAAYLGLFAASGPTGAWVAVMGIAIAGAFLKPVVPGTVRRHTSPEDRAVGFSYFYASVNAGSVVGKVLAKQVRTRISLQASMINAVVASVIGLVVTLVTFREPEEPAAATADATATPPAPKRTLLEDILGIGKQRELIVFLFVVTGYYLLIQQFYQTFPNYISRTLGEDAPREYVTLLNPAAIALLQVPVARATRRIPPLASMTIGGLVGSVSMLVMGIPTLPTMCLSFLIFAFAEMLFSARYYEYISSFAPPGREALYMGLAITPLGIGGLAGGILSGRLMERYLPAGGPHQPLVVWGTYAVIGVACSAAIGIFGLVVRRRTALGTKKLLKGHTRSRQG